MKNNILRLLLLLVTSLATITYAGNVDFQDILQTKNRDRILEIADTTYNQYIQKQRELLRKKGPGSAELGTDGTAAIRDYTGNGNSSYDPANQEQQKDINAVDDIDSDDEDASGSDDESASSDDDEGTNDGDTPIADEEVFSQEAQQARIDNLENINQELDRLPPSNASEVYSAQELWLDRPGGATIMNEGDIIAAYSRPWSFSENPYTGADFLMNRMHPNGEESDVIGTIYTVKNPTNGKPIASFSENAKESEVLFKQGSIFRVDSIEIHEVTLSGAEGPSRFAEVELTEIDAIPNNLQSRVFSYKDTMSPLEAENFTSFKAQISEDVSVVSDIPQNLRLKVAPADGEEPSTSSASASCRKT